jgi:hypothetical protein
VGGTWTEQKKRWFGGTQIQPRRRPPKKNEKNKNEKKDEKKKTNGTRR